MVPTRKVLDISHDNTVQSWEEIKAAGVRGIIHKATEGASYRDLTYAERRRDEARISSGLLWGAYHFLRPGNMVEQAQFFVETAEDDPNMLYAADHEDYGVSLDDLIKFCN